MHSGQPVVFISSEKSDYSHARRVYQFLVSRGISVFFAGESLKGRSNFGPAILEALDAAEHMIVVASSKENASKPWVAYEWGFFLTEYLGQRKTGNLVTIVVGTMMHGELPPGLRPFEVLELEADLERLLPYVSSRRPGTEPATAPTPPPSLNAPIASTASRASDMALASVLAEVEWDAGTGEVRPGHVFAALTRRWIVAHVYFDQLTPWRYISELIALRAALGARAESPPAPGVSTGSALRPRWTPEAQSIADAARERRSQSGELALLHALTARKPADVVDRLRQSPGPPHLEEVVQLAERWIEEGSRPRASVVQPNGIINPRWFVPELIPAQPAQESPADAVDAWDVLVGLVLSGRQSASWWKTSRLPLPSEARWSPGVEIEWPRLSTTAQGAISKAIEQAWDEGRQEITERILFHALVQDHLEWRTLPLAARTWLTAQGQSPRAWEKLCTNLETVSF